VWFGQIEMMQPRAMMKTTTTMELMPMRSKC
jgi:hypothetical protein